MSTCCERQIYVTEIMRRKCVCQIVHVLQCPLKPRERLRVWTFVVIRGNWRTFSIIGQLVITCFELDTRHTIKENNDENLWFRISCNFWAFYEPGQNIHSVSFILLPLPPWDFLSFSIAWDYLQQTVWSHFLQVVPQRRREDRPLSHNNRLCRLFWQSCPH